jgi:4-methylaminobutanoate oxidase (formaldehyde-forming)
MDMSFMGRFLVQGRDAGRCLDWISGNRVDGAEGIITYTPWMNAAGKLEADLTVAKLAADRFLVVATDTAVRHVETWLRRQIPAAAHAFVTDLGGAWAQLNLQGPRSRELLQSLTSVDLSNEAFPFRAIRELDIGLARVLCARLTYVGELGYELHIPVEQAVHVYDRLVMAGAAFGLRHAGLKALSSLRLEKGYRDYGHDLDNTDGPLEAGLGFALDFAKPGGFLGMEAVERLRARGAPCRRLCQVLLLDPEPLMFHGEVVLRDGIPVGYVRAASYGHTLGGAVGLAMIEPGARPHPDLPAPVPVEAGWLASGRWEVEVAGRRHAARVSLQPLYDPSLARVRA